MQCGVCGGTSFTSRRVLWQGLIDEWQISRTEAAYVDRQQGETCDSCGSNLRSIALAKYPPAVALLRAVYDIVDRIKAFESEAGIDGEQQFTATCAELSAAYDELQLQSDIPTGYDPNRPAATPRHAKTLLPADQPPLLAPSTRSKWTRFREYCCRLRRR